VECVHVSFGQRSQAEELKAARAITRHLKLPLREIALSGAGTFPAGEIWGRNAFLLSVALLTSRSRPGLLALGVHAGTAYFDCSSVFIRDMNTLVQGTTDGRVSISAPFLEWSKGEVIDYFLKSGIPLDVTYSCENGTAPACGVCQSCLDRVHL
jgi:7-cyano-7-deazaguanine synthase